MIMGGERRSWQACASFGMLTFLGEYGKALPGISGAISKRASIASTAISTEAVGRKAPIFSSTFFRRTTISSSGTSFQGPIVILIVSAAAAAVVASFSTWLWFYRKRRRRIRTHNRTSSNYTLLPRKRLRKARRPSPCAKAALSEKVIGTNIDGEMIHERYDDTNPSSHSFDDFLSTPPRLSSLQIPRALLDSLASPRGPRDSIASVHSTPSSISPGFPSYEFADLFSSTRHSVNYLLDGQLVDSPTYPPTAHIFP